MRKILCGVLAFVICSFSIITYAEDENTTNTTNTANNVTDLQTKQEEIKKQTTINSKDIALIDNKNEIENAEEIGSIELNGNFDISRANRFKDGQEVKFAGIITSIKKKFTKNNKIMAFVTVEDLYGTAEIIVFENAYIKSGKSLVEENIVIVEGRLSIREDDTTTIIANEIKNFGEQKQKVLILDINDSTEEQKNKLRGAIKYFCGDKNNINVQIKIDKEIKPCGQIYLTKDIMKVIQNILGDNRVKLEEK